MQATCLPQFNNPSQTEREREREREREKTFFVREKYVKNGRNNYKFIVRGCE